MVNTQAAHPNIILWMVDQLSAKWLELALKNNICPLPNFQRLQQEGVRFSNTITSNPVCCPARSTIATGLTSRGHGVLENGYGLSPALPTFMKQLQKAGYKTSAFGKLHFVPHAAGFDVDYHAYGFDVAHITEDSRGGEWLDWVKHAYPEYYEAALCTIWADYLPAFHSYGPEQQDLGARIRALQKDWDWGQREHPENSFRAYTLPFPKEVSQTEWITEQALAFLAQHHIQQPFFAQISYVQPHNPYCAPAEYLDLVDEAHIPPPVAAEWHTDPHTPAYFKRQQEFHLPNDAYGRKCYFADLVHLDEQLGKLRNFLQQTGLEQSTYLLFTSDHGDLLGDHGFYFKEERHYDACIRVPLVLCGPDFTPGVVCDELAQLEDIYPTILDLAGAQPAPLPFFGPYLKLSSADTGITHGTSLVPLCQGVPMSLRQAAYVESYNAIWSFEYTDWARTIRTKRYRYTYYAGNSGEQLFDLICDPDEQNNLAADPSFQSIKQQLKDELLEQIIRQDWPKTPQNLYFLGMH